MTTESIVEEFHNMRAVPGHITFSAVSEEGEGHSVIIPIKQYEEIREAVAASTRSMSRKSRFDTAKAVIHQAAACPHPEECGHDGRQLVAGFVMAIDNHIDRDTRHTLQTAIREMIRDSGGAHVIGRQSEVGTGARCLAWIVSRADGAVQ